jgi:RHS repeat-associated protein
MPEFDGSLAVDVPIDGSTGQQCACGANPPQEVAYNTTAQNPKLVLYVVAGLTAGPPYDSKIKLDYTWDGGPEATEQIFPLPSTYVAGTNAVMETLVPDDMMSTGRHYFVLRAALLDHTNTEITWVSLAPQAFYTLSPSDQANGQVFGGSGWTLGEQDRLIAVSASGSPNYFPAGLILWSGPGSYRFYTDQGDGSFVNDGPDRGKIYSLTGGGYKWVSILGVTEIFNADGFETYWISADGAKTVTFVYDSSDQLQNVHWYDGTNSTFNYYSDRISQIVTRFPAATNSGLGNTSTGALETYTFGYSGGEQVTSIQQPDGRTYYFTYDLSGELVESRIGSAASSGLNVNSYRYDDNGFLSQIRWGNFDSDSSGLNIYNFAPYNTLALVTMWYPEPMFATVTDPLNRTTSYSFDPNGFVTIQQNPDGGVYTYTRTPDNSDLEAMIIPGPSGPLTTAYVVDPLTGLDNSINYPDGTSEVFSWITFTSDHGVFGIDRHLLATYTNDIFTATFTFDAVGHTAGEFFDLGGIEALSSFTWSVEGVGATTNPGTAAYGNLLTAQDALLNLTTYSYDTDGRLLTQRDPIGTFTYDYDDKGNQARVLDRLGIPTTVIYDNLHNPVTVIRPDPDGTGSLSQWLGTYVYDDAEQLQSFTDPLSSSTTRSATFSYDSRGLPTGLTQLSVSGGVTTTLRHATLGYDGAGELTSYTNPNGKTTSYGYDLVSRLNSITYPDSIGTITATYFQTGWMKEMTDTRGAHTSFAYTAVGMLQSMTQQGSAGTADDRVTSYLYVYLPSVFKIAVTDALNNTSTFAYDAMGHLVSVTTPDPDGGGSLTPQTTTYTYDKIGNLTQITEPRLLAGSTSTYVISTFAYDAGYRLIDQSIAANTTSELQRTTFGYDADDRLTGMTESVNNSALLRTATYAYDNLGRLTDTTESTNVAATLRQSTFAYDAASRLVDTTFVANSTTYSQETTYAYDALDRLTGVTEAAGTALARSRSYGYDANDNLTSYSDPLGRLSTFSYDGLDRLTQVTQPDPAGGTAYTISTYAYDGNGNLTSYTDANNNTTNYSYDAFNELTQVTQPNPGGGSPVTSYAYDKAGNLLTITDPLSHVTSYNYDNMYRVISVVGPVPGGGAGSSVTQYNYNQAGDVAQVIESPGLSVQNITTYTYDNLGREQTESELVQLTGSTTTTATRTFAYDTLGRLQSSVDSDNRLVTYSYDALDRLTNEQWYSGPTTTSTLQRTITYAYDLRDNLTDANEGSGNVRTTFVYDALDRVTDTTQTIPQASGSSTFTFQTTYSYKADDQVESRRVLINGTLDSTLTYSYDGMGRVSDEKQTLNPSGSGNTEATFTYLPTGEIKTIQRKGGSSFTNAALTTYSYDALERVTAINTTQGTFSYSDTYTYDAASRITGETNTSGTATYTYYDNDQIKSASYSYASAESFSWDENGNPTGTGIVIGAGDRLMNDGTSTYEYDAEGNRTKKSTGSTVSTYSWDQRDRLTGMTTTASGSINKMVTVVYDAFNRRVAEYVGSNGNGNKITRRDHYVWDGDQVDTVANGTTTPTVTDRFLMGPGIDNVLADEKSGTVNWTITDVRGDVQEVLDSTGNWKTRKDYTAFGVKTDTGNPSTTDTVFAYAGREYDPDLGLEYNRNRWYDPAAKRFVSEDPIGFRGGDSNLQRYVGNAPTNHTDPRGLDYLEFKATECGKFEVYYVGTFLGLETSRTAIGLYDPDSGYVEGNGYQVDLELIQANVGLFHPRDWPQWYKDHGTPINPPPVDPNGLNFTRWWPAEEKEGVHDPRKVKYAQNAPGAFVANTGNGCADTGGDYVLGGIGGFFISRLIKSGWRFVQEGSKAGKKLFKLLDETGEVAAVGFYDDIVKYAEQKAARAGNCGPPPTNPYRKAQLPTRRGRFRFIAPEGSNPSNPVRGPRKGWMDKFGNEWVKGPPHHFPGENFEWDVQLPDGTHINVSPDGVPK